MRHHFGFWEIFTDYNFVFIQYFCPRLYNYSGIVGFETVLDTAILHTFELEIVKFLRERGVNEITL